MDMAKLLKKHFGLGSKKGPPHPPKPDYVAQKSSSVQELLSRSPTSEHRSPASLSSASSHIGSFDVAQLSDSPSRVSRLSQSSLASSLGFGGARPKEPKDSSGVPSPKDKHSSVSGCDDDIQDSPVEEPTLLDEYSDPFDLKKQIQETPDLRGACAPATAQAVAEDDYSVPYEVKKLMKEKKLREGSDKGRGSHMDENVYSDSPGRSSTSPSKSNNSIHAEDMRPREEYDEPWEWSQTHSMIFDQIGLSSDTAGPSKSTPLMTKRTTTGASGGTNTTEKQPGFGEIVAEAEAAVTNMSIILKEEEERQQNEQDAAAAAATTPSPDVEEVLDPPVQDEEAVQVVEEEQEIEYENMKDDYDKPQKPPEKEEGEEYERYTHLREDFQTRQQCPENDKRVGNYEEPWDLSTTQIDLEDRIKALVSAAGTSGGTVTINNDDAATTAASPAAAVAVTAGTSAAPDTPVASTSSPAAEAESSTATEAGKEGPSVIPDGDSRTQEGYEKPWDWKPHKKDDRPQDGYEKPWDWKPHQKDDRPQDEYEQPWDHKAQSIEQNIMKAKNAKDNLVEKLDNRPTDEYEEPWDQKQKRMLQRTGSDSSSSPSGPQRKLNLDLSASGWGAVAERIDPKLPLEQQGWYHGAISRVDAEALLRVHKEGSYLVRMSESNKMDFSLSLKSARGFMHMKIVHRERSFILGQFSQPFDTIPQMIHHYSVNKLPIKGAEHMSLLHPVMHELL